MERSLFSGKDPTMVRLNKENHSVYLSVPRRDAALVSARSFPRYVRKQRFHRGETSKIFSWVLSTNEHICVSISDVFCLIVMLTYLRMAALG